MTNARKIVVCGATGFIGRNVTEVLARRSDVRVTAIFNRRPPFECAGVAWRQADLTDPQAAQEVLAGCDVVIQAAATTSGAKDIVNRPHIHVTDNAVMNSLIFRAAHDLSVKHVVFFSCSIMLKNSPAPQAETDFDANAEIAPSYFGSAWTKVYLEKMAEFYARLGRTRHTVIRHSNVYGPHDKFDLERSHVFGATVTKVMTADDGTITVWGTGEEARDLIYVDDLIDLVERAIDRQDTTFEIVNCGSGEAVTVNDLVGRIIASSGRELRIRHDLSAPRIATTLSLDCAKAQALFGWTPRVSLDEGIRRTIAWWREAHDGHGSANPYVQRGYRADDAS